MTTAFVTIWRPDGETPAEEYVQVEFSNGTGKARTKSMAFDVLQALSLKNWASVPGAFRIISVTRPSAETMVIQVISTIKEDSHTPVRVYMVRWHF